MHGPEILLRTLSIPTKKGKSRKKLQYHPRSDHHSKVICWSIVFDLLDRCPLLRQHVEQGKVGFGINHCMQDFQQARKKDLDLVICTPSDNFDPEADTLQGLACHYGIKLTDPESVKLAGFPPLQRCEVGSVLVALEAKACMTEHAKARPRLYDELTSSALTVNGNTNSAIAACHVLINASNEFVSPTRENRTNHHNQPKAARDVLDKISQLKRRSTPDSTGYDAVGVSLIDCRNDGSQITSLSALSDGAQVPESINYDQLIHRLSSIYASRWQNI